MSVTVLAENISSDGKFASEHGLSLFIETEDKKILFDMGQTDLFLENARLLGVDIGSVELAVLSHGHYDHGGGLEAFLNENENAPVYVSRYAFEPHYNALGKYIGLDAALGKRERLVFADGKTEIAKGVTLFGGRGGSTLETLGARGMQVMGDSGLEPDDFRHEQYLLIEEKGKRYLFSGCSHRGAAEIREYYNPDVFLGGFHYSKVDVASSEGRKLLLSEAERLFCGNTVYLTCHCTGREQFEFLRSLCPERLRYISSGDRVEL